MAAGPWTIPDIRQHHQPAVGEQKIEAKEPDELEVPALKERTTAQQYAKHRDFKGWGALDG